MEEKYELLAPVGNFAMLQAAIDAGADSVYLGLRAFNMRATAKNFSLTDLKKVKKTCEKAGVKVYLTLNTIIYDNEITKIEKIIKKISEQKLADSVICWDFSVINLCRKYSIPFNVSTQASVSNTESAKFYLELGAEKLTLARELSLKQIKKIYEELPKKHKDKLEAFCHGAMCVAVSGRCFTSQFLFNKSANRGCCLHPCRRSYTVRDEEGNELKVSNNRIFSAKDLCTLPFIDKMKKAGVKTYKIEGRNRDPRYVSKVVNAYRKALERPTGKLTKKELEEETEKLKQVYNRKFSSGFYFGTPTSDSFTDTENSSAREKKHYVGSVKNFLPRISVAAVKLSSELEEGDKIAFIGNKTGYLETQVDTIEISHKRIKKAVKGQEVGIKTPKRVRENDEVYKIIKK